MARQTKAQIAAKNIKDATNDLFDAIWEGEQLGIKTSLVLVFDEDGGRTLVAETYKEVK